MMINLRRSIKPSQTNAYIHIRAFPALGCYNAVKDKYIPGWPRSSVVEHGSNKSEVEGSIPSASLFAI